MFMAVEESLSVFKWCEIFARVGNYLFCVDFSSIMNVGYAVVYLSRLFWKRYRSKFSGEKKCYLWLRSDLFSNVKSYLFEYKLFKKSLYKYYICLRFKKVKQLYYRFILSNLKLIRFSWILVSICENFWYWYKSL